MRASLPLNRDRPIVSIQRLPPWLTDGLLVALIVLPFIMIEMRRVRDILTIRHPDFFPITEWALALRVGEWAPWVNWQYPVGYPLLLRFGMSLGIGAVRVGHGLSILGGVLALISIYWTTKRLTQERWLAWFSAVFLSITSVFLWFGSYEGMDMLAAGLQLLSLAVLVQGEQRRWCAFAAGVLAGFSYMVRYTGQVTAAMCAIYLLIVALLRRRKSRWFALASYVIGFALGAGVQLTLSTAVTGTPFYTDQGRGVWFHVTGKHDFVSEWAQAPEGVTVAQVFADNPRRFVTYWWTTFSSFWLKSAGLLLDPPLTLLSQAGMLFTWFAGRHIRLPHRLLLSGFVLGHLAALGLMRMDPRFLIIVLPFMALGSVYFLWAVVPDQFHTRWGMLPLNKVVLVGALLWGVFVPLNFVRDAPGPDMRVIQPSNLLHTAGMRSAQEVVSTAISLHDVTALTGRRFDQLYWVAPHLDLESELLTFVQGAGYRFVLYDAETGSRVFAGLVELLTPGHRPVPGLTPVRVAEDRSYAVYRIEPRTPMPAHWMGAQLEQGITLIGYDLHLSEDLPRGNGHGAGVYLYWQNQGNISASYKVSVQVLSSSGVLVAQDDSIPAQWTSPTITWQSGEVVVDFHAIHLGPDLPPGDYTVMTVMYSETDGRRLALVDGAGHRIDDKVVLEKIALGAR